MGGQEFSEAGNRRVWQVLMRAMEKNEAGKGWGRCHRDGTRKGLPEELIVQKLSIIQEKTMLILQVFPLKLLKQIQRDDGATIFRSLGVLKRKRQRWKPDRIFF